ncbi:uncharacterized protein ACLA_044270 [Aspergillus clavatus NRRL 1]|uniref:Uncharacterized protein n=1 Tax=Aspergillus clavatus (strain ATCC 1007 / CBS 513.65 / DSM 816 / NCTC 3887 / NRRL 1 / QM 1276 / 107) TaxID=344612 RepID=A1C8S0_ASPCL|nr:uncharacterized protein ACLA_044270 [Aspergillus clavatus NRRL 1]EAW13707.1 hypothetical protein ACLA_044270 [Aspergillus clavatus NRRL 1]
MTKPYFNYTRYYRTGGEHRRGGRADAERFRTEPLPESFWDQAQSLKAIEYRCHFTVLPCGGNQYRYGESDRIFGELLAAKAGVPMYPRGTNATHDEQLDALKSLFEASSSSLKSKHGLDECIPHAKHVEDPDDEPH